MPGIQFLNTSLFSDSSLAAYYRLEDTTDSGPNAYNLTNNNSCTFISAKFSNGVSTGTGNTNKSLSVGSNLGILGVVPISMVGWFSINDNIGSSSTWTIADHRDSTSGCSIRLGYQGNGGTPQLFFVRTVNTVIDEIATYTFTPTVGVLYQISGVYDSVAKLVTLYVNGTQQAQISSANGTGIGIGDSFSLGATGNGFLFGDFILDDFAVLSRVLTATEISNLYFEVNRSISGAAAYSSPMFY